MTGTSGCLKRSWLIALITMLAVGVSGATSAADEKAAIKIGFVTSLSGSSGDDGKLMMKGVNLYLDQVGHKFAGHPVDLIVENDEGTPAAGLARFHKLVEQDHVDVLGGLILAHVAYPASEYVEKMGTPCVVALSGADDITQRKRKKWVIRTGWTSSQMAFPLGEYAVKKLHYKKIVTLASDYKHPYEVVGGFQKTFEENGGQIIQKLWVPLGFTDFKDTLKQIRPDADAVFMATVGQSTGIIPKQYKELGINKPIIASTVTVEESVFPKAGEYLVGAISSEPYSAALDSAANKKFASAYKAKYGEDACWFSETGYTCMMWMDHACQILKGDVSDKEKLLAALKKVQLKDDPRGPLKLDEYGQVDQNIYIRRVDKVNGKFQNTVIATYPAVSQFWKWKPEEFMKEPAFDKNYPPCKFCSTK